MADPWRSTTTMTILNGAAASEEIDLRGNGRKNPVLVTIITPAGLAETVNVQISSAPGGTYGILRSNGTDIALAAGKADTIGPILAGAFKLQATGNVAAQRDFQVLIEPFDRLGRF